MVKFLFCFQNNHYIGDECTLQSHNILCCAPMKLSSKQQNWIGILFSCLINILYLFLVFRQHSPLLSELSFSLCISRNHGGERTFRFIWSHEPCKIMSCIRPDLKDSLVLNRMSVLHEWNMIARFCQEGRWCHWVKSIILKYKLQSFQLFQRVF